MKKPKIYSGADLRAQILADAKALKLPEKWAETIADKTVQHVNKWIKGRGAVTDADLSRVAYEKLREYSADLAYIHKNRGKIL